MIERIPAKTGANTMKVHIVSMRDPTSTLRAGAHSSTGMDIETPWHYHDMHQVIYAFEGSVEVEDLAARHKVPHQFAVWIPAGAVHRTHIQKVRSGSVFLHAGMVPSPGSRLRVLPVSSLMREMIIEAMRWPIDGAEDAVGRAYFDCFARLCGEWITREVKLALPASSDPRINAIMKHTRDHLAEITLRELCRKVAMSERTLRRRFSSAVGMTWEEFRLRLRMCEAIDLLETTGKPVGVIAAEVGYASQAAFAKAFKGIMGVEPSVYRRGQR